MIHTKKVSDFYQIPLAQEAAICETEGHDMNLTTTQNQQTGISLRALLFRLALLSLVCPAALALIAVVIVDAKQD